ncbi:tRNA modification GTPase [Nitrobacteraceae bacterium AZCC 1564]
MLSPNQTIFALSSGRAPTAIAVIRLSGPQARAAVESLCGKIPAPRVAHLATLRNANHEPIDEGVVLWFPGPHSVTGEDVAEFQVHGGRAVIAAMFEALGKIGGLRPAEPGEFTRRAFENGKLDLTEAEGLDDLIHADTDRQRRQALRQLRGLLGNHARDWREQIIKASAMVEAAIDFSDEGDVPDDLIGPAKERVRRLLDEIEGVLAIAGRSERLRDGLVVAITGAPNVGKSTLMNQLARRDVAIVSPQAGTTRDIIEVHLDLDGYPVTLIDTAGIHETLDPIELEGIRRAKARAGDADLIFWLVDGRTDEARGGPNVAEWNEGVPNDPGRIWTIRNKLDDLAGPTTSTVGGQLAFSISAKNGRGLSELMDSLVQFASSHFDDEVSLITRARHRTLLQDAADALGRALSMKEEPELIAEELRIAIHSLGRLTGRVDVEDILDSIFRDFCIGK